MKNNSRTFPYLCTKSIVMKTLSLVLFLSFLLLESSAQTTKTKTTAKKTTTTKSKAPVKKAPAPVVIKDVTVNLHNEGEGTISVFAGHKEDLKNPKLTIIGGLSNNKLYLKTNDVVCIINKGKAMACASIKSSTVSLSINSSATEIHEK